MKPIIRSILISFTVLLFTLSPAPCRAEVKCKLQNFHELISTGNLTITPPLNTIGTTDFVTYTCSGESAKFGLYGGVLGEMAIFLESSKAQVVTSKIQDLTRIIVTFLPATDLDPPQVEISTTGDGGWVELAPVKISSTSKAYNMPSVGDYYIRIKRKGTTSAYIKAIDYCRLDLSGCPNCFIYKPE